MRSLIAITYPTTILTFCLMLLSTTSSAADYDWRRYISEPSFPTAFEACQHYIRISVYAPNVITEIRADVYDETWANCYVSYNRAPADPVKNIFFLNVYRFGNECTGQKTYNPTTYSCSLAPQMGRPPLPTQQCLDSEVASNGNNFYSVTDSTAGPEFTRYYNSFDGVWRHNYSTSVRTSPGGSIAVVHADGRESYFIKQSSTYTASSLDKGALEKSSTGWTYNSDNGDRYTFDESGLLTGRSSPSGASYAVTRASNNLTIVDNLGRIVSIAEDYMHQPLFFKSTGLEATYAYDSKYRLLSVTKSSAGKTSKREYYYEDSLNPSLLTRATDESGASIDNWKYNAGRKVISREGPVQQGATSFSYDTDSSTTASNEYGKQTQYRFQFLRGVNRITAIVGEPSPNCPGSNSTYTYDAQGLLKTKTDAKGNLTTYDYNDRGLETSRTEASGTPQARTVTTEWHPTLFLKTKVTEPDRITTYQYDTQGRQTGQIVTPR